MCNTMNFMQYVLLESINLMLLKLGIEGYRTRRRLLRHRRLVRYVETRYTAIDKHSWLGR